MFTLVGILFVVAGAALTFAVDRRADAVDLQLAGWILMAGGGLSVAIGFVRVAAVAAADDASAGDGRPSVDDDAGADGVERDEPDASARDSSARDRVDGVGEPVAVSAGGPR